MNSSSTALRRALELFPKLYFYVPPTRRRAVAGLIVTEDIAAILWMLELYAAESEYVSQAAVRDALGMRQDRLSRLVVKLAEADCIKYRSDLGDDHRTHWLKLTGRGRSVLSAVKAERTAIIEDLLSSLSVAQREAGMAALEGLATAAWYRIKARRSTRE